MIIDQPRALQLGAWDWRSFSIMSFTIFILTPIVFALFGYFFKKIFGKKVTIFLYISIISYFISVQLVFYYVETGSEITNTAVLVGIFVILTIFLYWAGATVVRMMAITCFVSIFIFGYFFWATAPTSVKVFDTKSDISTESSVPHVFILTFEKLVWSYISNENNNIDEAFFPNLSEFAKKSDLYTNAHSSASATHLSLKAIYTGRVLSLAEPASAYPNMLNILDGQYDVYFLNDVSRNICDPIVHSCITTMGKINDSRRLNLIAGFWKTWAQNVFGRLAAFLGVADLDWSFDPFGDMWFKEVAAQGFKGRLTADQGRELLKTVGKRQMNYLYEVLDESADRDGLYIVHNFISDGSLVKQSRLDVPPSEFEELIKKQKTVLKDFDDLLGELIADLKRRGIFDESLIVLTSDTAYTTKWKEQSGPSFGDQEIPHTPEFSNVLMVIKGPNQVSGKVITRQVRHIDIAPTVLARMGIETPEIEFEGVDLSEPGIDLVPSFLHYTSRGGHRSYSLNEGSWILDR